MHKTYILFCISFISILQAQSPIIIAHRGASAYAPENTLEAFEKAITMGANCIETDVHQTKDGEVVIMHDFSVQRTTNGKGLIKNLSLEKFKSLNIKYRKKILETNPPTLEEAIQLINGRCNLIIELKKGNSYYPGIESKIISLIKKYQAETWISAIHSFEKEALINITKNDSHIKLQKLIVFNLPLVSFSFDKQFSKDDFSNWQGVNVNHLFCSKRLIKQLHGLNKTVFAWTVNSPRKAKRLAKRGVDGIITNKPDILTKK